MKVPGKRIAMCYKKNDFNNRKPYFCMIIRN